MKFLLTTLALFSLALSTTAHPDTRDAVIPKELPHGIAELMSRNAKLTPRELEITENCVLACNAGCDYCGDRGCLSNCQLNW